MQTYAIRYIGASTKSHDPRLIKIAPYTVQTAKDYFVYWLSLNNQYIQVAELIEYSRTRGTMNILELVTINY